MGILSPLYLLGALALAVPLYLHLKRRPPRERVPFSSLMFLRPTRAVRVARTSKLEQLGLLALRCLALVALVAAFARPFLRGDGAAGVPGGGGARLVLVDESASMGRAGVWGEVAAAVEGEAGGARAGEGGLSVWAFGDSVRRVFPSGSGGAGDVAGAGAAGDEFSVALLGEPRGGGTALGVALAEAAEELAADGGGEVVLVSDLQSGADLGGLQSVAWPDGVEVRLVPVGQAGGAWSVSSGWVSPLPDGTPRVRLVVPAEATGPGAGEIALAWEGASGEVAGEPVRVVVAPGKSRVVAVPWPAGFDPAGGAVLRMSGGGGDPFDDALAFAPPVSTEIEVFLPGWGGEGHEPAAGEAGYFLARALVGDAQRAFRFTGDPAHADVAFVAGPLEGGAESRLVERVRQDGVLALVVASGETAGLLDRLSGGAVSVGEELAGRYAMLEGLAFDHPLLGAFADPAVRDFSKVRFWRRRGVGVPEAAAVLARFDDGEVAWAAVPCGEGGQTVVFASGWTPEESQLALSSKFVPLLFSLLEGSSAVPSESGSMFTVGQAGAVSALAGGVEVEVRPLWGGGGEPVRVPAGGSHRFGEPGLYGVKAEADPRTGDARQFVVAANLPARESELAPLPRAELASLGVVLAGRTGTAGGTAETASAGGEAADEPAAGARVSDRERAVQLEGQQKLWRWVVVLLMVVLVIESWLAGRRGAVVEEATPEAGTGEGAGTVAT